eukprot:10442580-Ditylum_brightwellii.AAC.2
MGYHSSFPRAIALASTDYYSIGIQHIKALHMAMQIENIVKNIRAGTDSGKVSQCMIHCAQLCASYLQTTLPYHT